MAKDQAKAKATARAEATAEATASAKASVVAAAPPQLPLKAEFESSRIYGFKPFVPHGTKVLILGSMPSVKSLEQGFYYAHPQNRMFKLIGHYLALKRGLDGDTIVPLPDVPSRQAALSELGIALYDVVDSCERVGSLDSKIKAASYSDIVSLLRQYPSITTVLTNGGYAKTHFAKSTLKHPAVVNGEVRFTYYALPSTSPCNTVPYAKLQALYDEVLLGPLGLTP